MIFNKNGCSTNLEDVFCDYKFSPWLDIRHPLINEADVAGVCRWMGVHLMVMKLVYCRSILYINSLGTLAKISTYSLGVIRLGSKLAWKEKMMIDKSIFDVN